MDGWMDEWMMDGRLMDGWMDGWMDGCIVDYMSTLVVDVFIYSLTYLLFSLL